jgi:peroxiredoxin
MPSLIFKSAFLAAFVCAFASMAPAESSERSRAESPAAFAGLPERYAAPAADGADLIGTNPPEWDLGDWINSPPLTLKSLRGKVVLVRWWTAPGCEFCAASAPALNDFSERYHDRGLVVVGVYHHKSRTPLTREHVETSANNLRFHFPVAVDRDWKTLKSWWLDKGEHRWTSVTFLLDRHGVVRHVHGGGAFFKGELGYDALDAAIRKLLAEK